MSHTVTTPHAIVAQAESATELPGLRKLCVALKGDAVVARDAGAEAKLKRLEIARQLCVYGERPEVAAEVTRLEVNRRLMPDYKGGRPYAGKTIAARELARAAGIPERTIERWLGEWTRLAKALEQDAACERSIEELRKVNPHAAGKPLAAWFESLEAAGSEGEEEAEAPPPEKIARSLARTFNRFFFDDNGRVRLDAKARRAVMKELNPELNRIGWELSPLGKE